jgi:predicted dienelactone hydrolase
MVAAPDHWGNTYDNKIPEYFVRYWERPLDISFVLTRLLGDYEYNSTIDSKRVGLVGFSFGGYTALSIAGVEVDCELLKEKAKTKQGKTEFTVPEVGDLRDLIYGLTCDDIPKSLKDSRFTAFVSLAPALGLGLPDNEQIVTSPLLIVGVGEDNITPVKTNALRYHELIPGSDFLILDNEAGHYIFLNEGDEELKKVAKKYYRDHKGISRAQIHKQTSEVVLSFLKNSWK